MNTKVQKSMTVATGLFISFTTINLDTVQAATISLELEGIIETGALIGETYSGTFSFDDVSQEVEAINFNFLGATFTESDADTTPTVAFFNNDFLGLDYTVTVTDPNLPVANFTISSGFFDVSDALFDYTPRTGSAGIGSLTYSSPSSSETPESVPEPSVTAGLLLLGLSGLVSSLKKDH